MSGKNSRAWWKSKKTTQLTHKLLTRKQLALHTYIHAYIHAYIHTCMHAYIHTTQLVHTQLAHTYSSTHNLLHTNPSPSLFSFLLSPCHLYLSFAACWKKLTCGVIRSFNFKLTTSRTKQFCETSFKHGKLSAELMASYQMRFAIFPVHLSKLLRLPRKSDARSYESAAPVTQNHLSKPEDLRLQNATRLRKSAPGPPNSSDEHVSCTAPATETAALQILFKCPTPAIFFGNATKLSRFAHF